MKKKFFIFLTLSLFFGAALQIDFQRFTGNKGGDCPFCRKELLDAQVFYRGDQVLGLLTHKPAVPGHVLIIPERHVERFEELTDGEWVALSNAIKKIDVAVRTTFGTKDYVLIQKNGREAGQAVPHVHFHYLPGTKFLAFRFLLSSWLKPLKAEEIKLLKETLSESINSLIT